MYEEVEEREAIAQYQITPVDTKWIDTNKAFEEESHANQITTCCKREMKSEDRPDLYAGSSPLESLKSKISIAANHKHTFSIIHIDVSRAYFGAEARRRAGGTVPIGGQNGRRRWEKSVCCKRLCASNLRRNWQEQIKSWAEHDFPIVSIRFAKHPTSWGSARRSCFVITTHGDDFVLTRDRQTGLQTSKIK